MGKTTFVVALILAAALVASIYELGVYFGRGNNIPADDRISTAKKTDVVSGTPDIERRYYPDCPVFTLDCSRVGDKCSRKVMYTGPDLNHDLYDEIVHVCCDKVTSSYCNSLPCWYYGSTCPDHHTYCPDWECGRQERGCYKDDTSRVLNSKFFERDHMTIGVCLALCNGYKFAGLQYGRQCFCGNSGYDRLGGSSGCNMPCSGDSSETCGGVYAMNVYAIDAMYKVGDFCVHPDPWDAVQRRYQCCEYAGNCHDPPCWSLGNYCPTKSGSNCNSTWNSIAATSCQSKCETSYQRDCPQGENWTGRGSSWLKMGTIGDGGNTLNFPIGVEGECQCICCGPP